MYHSSIQKTPAIIFWIDNNSIQVFLHLWLFVMLALMSAYNYGKNITIIPQRDYINWSRGVYVCVCGWWRGTAQGRSQARVFWPLIQVGPAYKTMTGRVMCVFSCSASHSLIASAHAAKCQPKYQRIFIATLQKHTHYTHKQTLIIRVDLYVFRPVDR